ncbi:MULTISPECIES: ParB/RepB/Spo0J family partition protein [Enterobacter]|uniref:ParB/RepB/Spo0J family partition protein n=1 Tax=Enterobacter soli TaxID=885040 RepID=A0AAW8HHS4_9ENTR|nr:MULTISPECIES: ParB/RepB/Spo0J family partition protein [Enterobacter]EFE5937857.1 ParB/RepB/Spo0J family partition protein [Escherichia coli]EIZ2433493.1 ParB/RepB/Spo0J family partition protein [Cronobacter sakazakii]EIZ2458107.1 ParB/RepB/Spo0J family partition protein [Cronobacter sakazakii]EIZ9682022.1 ParB/RepB/Spo0J family partition protein [Cronobacter sakazakii]EIZ9687510.1 ParB/RepB/Spo0J family partition protein [Cronobacter sakazakii]
MAKNFKDSIGGGKKDALISQLIRGTTQKEEEFTLDWLPHEKVYSVAQARKKFINIENLASSMKGRQQIQAITVYPADADGRHQIKTGERRWRAAVLNNEPVLAIILNRQKKVVPQEVVADAKLAPEQLKVRFEQIKENDQREPLTPMEMAEELGNMRDLFNLKPGQIAEGIGRPAAYVSKHLKLLEMPEEVRNLMEDGIVTYIETLNIITSVFAVSRESGLELVDEARSKGELSRSEAQEFLKAIKGKSAQQTDSSGTQQPENKASELNDNNGTQQPENEAPQLNENSGTQLPANESPLQNDNSGIQQPDNEEPQLDVNSATQQPDYEAPLQNDNSGTQQPDNEAPLQNDNSGTQQPENKAPLQTDNNGTPHADIKAPMQTASKEPQNAGIQKVTFYVKIDDDVFELIDKPSIVENGEVHVFCREREGMPEMQVPISDCTLHHASLTK